jgi:hypothetical protein
MICVERSPRSLPSAVAFVRISACESKELRPEVSRSARCNICNTEGDCFLFASVKLRTSLSSRKEMDVSISTDDLGRDSVSQIYNICGEPS